MINVLINDPYWKEMDKLAGDLSSFQPRIVDSVALLRYMKEKDLEDLRYYSVEVPINYDFNLDEKDYAELKTLILLRINSGLQFRSPREELTQNLKRAKKEYRMISDNFINELKFISNLEILYCLDEKIHKSKSKFNSPNDLEDYIQELRSFLVLL